MCPVATSFLVVCPVGLSNNPAWRTIDVLSSHFSPHCFQGPPEHSGILEESTKTDREVLLVLLFCRQSLNRLSWRLQKKRPSSRREFNSLRSDIVKELSQNCRAIV